MSHEDLRGPQLPSTAKLAIATAISLGLAAIILIVAVLPVEYGVDPLGVGTALGLVRPAESESVGPAATVPDGQKLAPTPIGPVAYYNAEYSLDHAQFELGPYEYVEYKYRLEQAATMTFVWDATAQVIHDFHGVPDGAAADQEVSFDKQERRRASGTHTAPFAGMHGWFWENPGGNRITVSLTSAGFYTSALEYRSPRNRRPHELTPLRTLTGAWARIREGSTSAP